MAKTKRITLHPLREDGSIDLTTNLYPKTLKDGIVDETGKEVSIQDELVSGENIKTINGESILGSGNIEIEVPTGEFVDTTTNQDVGGDKTFIDIATFEDDVVFKGALIDKESNQVEIKEISKATNLENGTGNGSLIQTNAALDSGNEWSSANSSIATVVDGLVTAVAQGETTITCIREGAEAECLVTVKPRLRASLRSVSGVDALDNYEVVTSINDLSGEIYMIATGSNYNKQFNGITSGYGEAVDISDAPLIMPLTFNHVQDGEENEFTISFSGGTLYTNANKKLYASNQITENSKWFITFENNNAVIINKQDDTWKIQYNSGSPRFACYASAQQPIMLVKAVQHTPVTGITLSDSELVLDSGAEYSLTATVTPQDADQRVDWTSSDTDIVTVDSGGHLTAGLLNVTSTATITATTRGTTSGGQTLSATCEVTVRKQTGPAITLSSSHLTLRVGDTAQLTVKYAQKNIASGNLSTAFGHSNTVSGNTSTAIGSELISETDNQVVVGKYNRNKSTTLFEVGNGTVDNRSNALEVHADGSVKVYVDPVNNNDLTRKSYVDNLVSTKANDNAVVHLTDDEIINGDKSFNNTVSLNGAPLLCGHTSDGLETFLELDSTYTEGEGFALKNIASITGCWENLILESPTVFYGKLKTDLSEFGLLLPDTVDYTEDRTIATEEYVDETISQKATVWEVDGMDPDGLANWLDENASKLKGGDLLYFPSWGTAKTMYVTNTQITLTDYDNDYIYDWIYMYSDQDEEWFLDSQTETPIGGTKLYRHNIEFSDGNAINFSSTSSTIIGDIANIEDLFNSANANNLTYYDDALGDIASILTIHSGEIIYYSQDNAQIKIINISSLSSFIDTVTPL